jgi:hypothetical protein
MQRQRLPWCSAAIAACCWLDWGKMAVVHECYMYKYVYIYIYIKRERERDINKNRYTYSNERSSRQLE